MLFKGVCFLLMKDGELPGVNICVAPIFQAFGSKFLISGYFYQI